MERDPQPIEALLSARSVAVVGASERSYVGRHLILNLQTLGFEGSIYAVNPGHDTVLGVKCYPSIDELPDDPEAVVLAVHHSAVPDALESAGKRGARAAVIPGGGFIESGVGAVQSQHLVADIAERHGMALAGPNCMGVIGPANRFAMYIGVVTPTLLPGHVALVSQSGSVVEAMVNMGPRIGFSALISCGNEARTTVGDYLRFFAGHDETRAVALFLEGFRDGPGFVAGAKAMREASKPVAVLHAGRTEQAARAVAAHTGTVATSDEVVRGVLRSVGAIGVDDLDELIELCELLGHGRLPKGRRMFVVTDSGGESSLVADQADRAGLELPPPSERLTLELQERWPNYSYIRNPMDPWAVSSNLERMFREVLRLVAQEDVDVVAVALDKVTPYSGEPELMLGMLLAEALIDASARAGGDGPLAVYLTVPSTGPATREISDRLREAGIPLLHGARAALAALRHAWWWGRWRPRTPPPPPEPPIPLSFPESVSELSGQPARDILSTYGILKSTLASARVPPGVVPLRVEMRRDPAFGPVVTLGVGGPLRSLAPEVAVRPCPTPEEDLEEMPKETPAGRLLEAEGIPTEPVLAALAALGRLALDHPEVHGAVVDPLLAGPHGAAAGEASITSARQEW